MPIVAPEHRPTLREELAPLPGARTGVKLLMLSTPKAGAGKARDVGTSGRLKTPYRSFRFGSEGV